MKLSRLCVLHISDRGEDFIANETEIVTFDEGSVDGEMECLNISIVDDDDFEGEHVFRVEIMEFSPESVNITNVDSTLASCVIQDNGKKYSRHK